MNVVDFQFVAVAGDNIFADKFVDEFADVVGINTAKACDIAISGWVVKYEVAGSLITKGQCQVENIAVNNETVSMMYIVVAWEIIEFRL